MDDPTQDSQPLMYAIPSVPTGSGLAAGVFITMAGLGLIVLGGCFCIGIMTSENLFNVSGSSPFAPRGNAGITSYGFIVFLYALAIACFGAAAFVLVLGIRKLLAVGRS